MDDVVGSVGPEQLGAAEHRTPLAGNSADPAGGLADLGATQRRMGNGTERQGDAEREGTLDARTRGEARDQQSDAGEDNTSVAGSVVEGVVAYWEPGPRSDDASWGMGSGSVSEWNMHVREAESDVDEGRSDDNGHVHWYSDDSDDESSTYAIFYDDQALYDEDEHRYGGVRFTTGMHGGVHIHLHMRTDMGNLQQDVATAMGRTLFAVGTIIENDLYPRDAESTRDDGGSSRGFSDVETGDMASMPPTPREEPDDDDWSVNRECSTGEDHGDDDADDDSIIRPATSGLARTDTVWFVDGSEYDRHGVLIERSEGVRTPNRPTTINFGRSYTGHPAVEYLFTPRRF